MQQQLQNTKYQKIVGIVPYEVPTHEEKLIYKHILKNVSQDAVILITGGGSIGSQWLLEEHFIRQIIKDYKQHKIIVFPQTIYYKNDEIGDKEKQESQKVYAEAKKLYLCIREKESYEISKKLHPNTHILLMPDIVLYLDGNNKNEEKRKDEVLICIRSDAESNLKIETKIEIEKISRSFCKKLKYTDTVEKRNIRKNERKIELINKLKEFSEAKLVITDRLHGMIFALITGTPCVVFSNYNHKVKGVYEWIKDYEYIQYLEDIKDLKEKLDLVIKIKNCKYKNRLKEKYDELENIITGE